ncbi:hypothetical protein M430DRAFT_96398, partial [Amorphotheca resinae ATCC 22711]
GNLELDYYSKEVLEDFTTTDYISCLLLLILFINDFSIYCNIYRALKGFYVTLIYLDFNKRRKPLNKFTLTLSPYNVSF